MARFEPHLMPLVQQIGRLDVELMLADLEWVRIVRDEKASIASGDALQGHITQSYLWVLGAYELVRTLTQRMKEGSEPVSKNVIDSFQSAKRRFTRLRIPLAKMEPASAHAAEDSHIAYPGVHQDYGVTWQLGPTTLISRRELSDSLLEALELARKDKLQQQAQIQEGGA